MIIRCPPRYPSDMKDKEWEIVQPLLPPATANQQNKLRKILDAIFYLDKTGYQWRALPHEYPPWSSVYYHFAKWSKDGTLEVTVHPPPPGIAFDKLRKRLAA